MLRFETFEALLHLVERWCIEPETVAQFPRDVCEAASALAEFVDDRRGRIQEMHTVAEFVVEDIPIACLEGFECRSLFE
ncbi:hypothetical protein ASG52_23390 [Methylobacterium sp. Leaf456]|nr:hypothetical protein ASG52_23390 [Methylobacterium sp. Leaf456]